MTDELITDLAKIKSLRVISHTSVLQYQGSHKALQQIGRELGVDAVVEGSVARSGNHVKIRTQLIDAHAEGHIWADSYERDLRDVIALQNELAREIAGQIRIQLTPQEQASLTTRPPRVPEAYENYLHSRYFINNRRSVEGLSNSVEYSRRAVQMDPNYPMAYAGLAHSLISLSFVGGLSPKQAMPQAEAAARKALELDPSLSQAHLALAMIRTSYDWDWPGAESELKRALELDPNDPDVHKEYGNYLEATGRSSEAVEEAKRSWQLDPFSLWANRNLGRALFFARRYDDAIAELRKVAEMEPGSQVLFNWLAWSYEGKGMALEAVQSDLRNQINNGLSPEETRALQHELAVSGRKGYWERLLKIKLRSPDNQAFELAQINARLGHNQQAFAWLKLACEQRVAWMTYAKVDPTLDPLRSDHRFGEVLRCINMQQ
jgi:tetratricopeptide (TPR) repeat protein